jgi:hypothetical protein
MQENDTDKTASVHPIVMRVLSVLEIVCNERSWQRKVDRYSNGWCDAVDAIDSRLQPILNDIEHLASTALTLVENTGVDCQGGMEPKLVEKQLIADLRDAIGVSYVMDEHA